jgi:Tol biopolymer transport system component
LFSDLSPSSFSNTPRPSWAAGGDTLVYRPRNDNLRFVWVTRSGTELSVPGPAKLYSAPSLSPRGDRIAVEIADDGKFDIWLFDLTRQALTNFTSDGISRYPMWTPDGLHLGMVHRRSPGALDIYWRSLDGNGLRQLVRPEYGAWIGSWAPDSRTLVYMLEDPTTHSDLWATDLSGKRGPWPIVQTPAREYGGRLSPDGRWLSYLSDATGRFELYLMPFQARHPRWQLSREGAREAVWSRDGRELFYRNGTSMLSVSMPNGGTLPPGRPKILFERDYFQTGGPGIVNYDVAPDGQRFLMLKRADSGSPRFTVIQGLERLVREHLQPAQ